MIVSSYRPTHARTWHIALGNKEKGVAKGGRYSIQDLTLTDEKPARQHSNKNDPPSAIHQAIKQQQQKTTEIDLSI